MREPEPALDVRDARSLSGTNEDARLADDERHADEVLVSVSHADCDDDREDAAGSALEQPCREMQLAEWDAQLLGSLLHPGGSMTAPSGAPVGNDSTRPLYDWFLSALNFTPMFDVLLGFVERLATWKKSAQQADSSHHRGEGSGAATRANWPDQEGLRV